MTHPEILRAEKTGYPRPLSKPQMTAFCDDCGRAMYEDETTITCSICGMVGCKRCIKKDWIDNVNVCESCLTNEKNICEHLNHQADQWERLFKSEAKQKQKLIKELEQIHTELCTINHSEMKETVICLASIIKSRIAFIIQNYKERSI